MAKIREFKYEHDGKVHCHQYWFRCPGCKIVHAIGVGVHSFNGDFDKPTFSPSLLCRGKTFKDPADPSTPVVDMCCHSYIREGQIQFLGDCTHSLAGKTVELADVPLEGEL